MLEHVCGRPWRELLEVLGQCEAAGFVAELPSAISRYRFLHDLVRETLYLELRPVDRRRLHRSVGEAIESLTRNDKADHVSALAHHFYEAAMEGQPDKAAEYCALAGRRAMTTFAYEEAARQYRRALEVPPGERDERKRCELLLAW